MIATLLILMLPDGQAHYIRDLSKSRNDNLDGGFPVYLGNISISISLQVSLEPSVGFIDICVPMRPIIRKQNMGFFLRVKTSG